VIIQTIVFPLVIVGLPDANDIHHLSKHDYTTGYTVCQEKYDNTLEFNFIKTQDYIESNLKKYEDILW
jgi:hypothetical protein